MVFSRIRAVASYLPQRVVDNASLVADFGFGKPPAWLEERTGIRARHFACDGDTTVTMAEQVLRKLSAQAGLRTGESGDRVDLLVLTTYTGELACPGAAITAAGRAGLQVGLAFDLAAACAGFGAGLDLADRYLRSGCRRAIVVSSEVHSRCLDFSDVRTAGLFGDGAAGVLLERGEEPGIEGAYFNSTPENNGFLVRYNAGAPESVETAAQTFYMPGNRDLSERAPPFIADLGRGALGSAGLDICGVRWVVPHQANLHIVKSVCRAIGAKDDQVFANLDRLGNCGSASVALGIAEIVERGLVAPGERLLTISAGAGFTGVAHVIRM